MKPTNTITKTQAYRRLLPVLALLLSSVCLMAHGGFEHVIGTVVTFANGTLTVKTAKGNAEVRINDTTEITKQDHKAAAADLKPGTRVVVDVPEGSKDHVAHSVAIGVTNAAPASAPAKGAANPGGRK